MVQPVGARAADSGGADLLGDLALARRLWPLLAATLVAALPAVGISIFVAPIAVDVGSTVARVGALRGLAGLAALATGVLLAPLIDRLPRAVAAAIGLGGLVVASLLLATGHLAALVAFNLLIGAATALLLPTLQAASADGLTGAAGGRAAGMLTSVQGLANVAGGPLLAALALAWGWRGAFLGLAATLLALLAVTARRLDRRAPGDVVRAGYLESFRRVADAPGAVALLLFTFVRTAFFLGWLTYFAAYFSERLGATTAGLAGAWSVGSGSFFVASLAANRWLNAATDSPWRRPERILPPATLVGVCGAPVVFLAPTWPPALAATAVTGLTMGVATVATIGLLVRRYAALRGPVLGLNLTGVNLGTFAGATLASIGLALGDYAGLALTLLLLGAASAAIAVWAVRAGQ